VAPANIDWSLYMAMADMGYRLTAVLLSVMDLASVLAAYTVLLAGMLRMTHMVLLVTLPMNMAVLTRKAGAGGRCFTNGHASFAAPLRVGEATEEAHEEFTGAVIMYVIVFTFYSCVNNPGSFARGGFDSGNRRGLYRSCGTRSFWCSFSFGAGFNMFNPSVARPHHARFWLRVVNSVSSVSAEIAADFAESQIDKRGGDDGGKGRGFKTDSGVDAITNQTEVAFAATVSALDAAHDKAAGNRRGHLSLG
jgi:hypothetical protein